LDLRSLDRLELEEGSLDPVEDRLLFDEWITEEGLEGEDFLFRWFREAVSFLSAQIDMERTFSDADLFELRHFDVFSTEGRRLAGRQYQQIASSLPPFDLSRISIQTELPESETELSDAGYYPAGGLAELTNRGSLESLVSSELIYMDSLQERQAARQAARQAYPPADLFFLRYLESELLYYKRDEGRLMRRQRTVHLILLDSPDLHGKLPHHPCQLPILLSGFLLRLCQDLLAIFLSESLNLHLYFPEGTSPQTTEENAERRELFELFFQNEIQRHEASIHSTLPQKEDIEQKQNLQHLLVFAPVESIHDLLHHLRQLSSSKNLHLHPVLLQSYRQQARLLEEDGLFLELANPLFREAMTLLRDRLLEAILRVTRSLR